MLLLEDFTYHLVHWEWWLGAFPIIFKLQKKINYLIINTEDHQPNQIGRIIGIWINELKAAWRRKNM